MDTACHRNDSKPCLTRRENPNGVLLTIGELTRQRRHFKGTGGMSEENRGFGFLPAFRDASTGRVYLSRFADGRIAPMHLLEGLPPELVVQRAGSGRVTAVRNSVTAGFVKAGQFYTRSQAADALDAENRRD